MLIDDNSDDDVYHFEDSFVMLMTMFLLVEKAWVSTCIGIGPLREKLRASRVFDILFTCCHLLATQKNIKSSTSFLLCALFTQPLIVFKMF